MFLSYIWFYAAKICTERLLWKYKIRDSWKHITLYNARGKYLNKRCYFERGLLTFPFSSGVKFCREEKYTNFQPPPFSLNNWSEWLIINFKFDLVFFKTSELINEFVSPISCRPKLKKKEYFENISLFLLFFVFILKTRTLSLQSVSLVAFCIIYGILSFQLEKKRTLNCYFYYRLSGLSATVTPSNSAI